MPHREDDYDDEDDRPRRRSRPRDEDDDDGYDDRPKRRRPKPPPMRDNSDSKMLWLIIGGVALVLILGFGACGLGGFFVMKNAGKGFDDFEAQMDATDTASDFFVDLQDGNADAAYLETSSKFQQANSKAAFEAALKKYPMLTKHKYAREQTFGAPMSGTKPQRKMTVKYDLTMNFDDEFDFDDADTPNPKPKPKPNAKLVVGLTVAEQPDGTWKVDEWTLP